MRARWIGRAARVHEGESTFVPQWQHRAERRMQSEKAIEVGYSALAVESSDCDSRARIVIGRLAVRHHHVESVDRATQKDHHQAAFAIAASARCPRMPAQQHD